MAWSQQGRHNGVFCPHHPESRLIADHETGDLVCPQCGLVVGDRLVDAGAEWRNFEGDDKSRVGKAEDPLLDLNDLGTMLGPTPAGGNEFSKYAKYSGMSSKERTLRLALREMKDSAGRLHLSDSIVETAFGLYKDVTDRVVFRGAHKDALGIACLYIACNQERVPRALDEMCKASTSTKKQVARCYKEIFKLLKIRDSTEGREKEFVERFCSSLQLSQDVVKLATAIAEVATEKDIFPDRGPDVVCGAAILLACAATDQPTRLTYVVEVTGASRNGLGVAYKTLVSSTETVYPADFVPDVAMDDLPKVEAL